MCATVFCGWRQSVFFAQSHEPLILQLESLVGFVQQQMVDSQSLVLFTNAKVFGREPLHTMSLMCLSSSVMVIPPIASIS
jgi:hypothetical protein